MAMDRGERKLVRNTSEHNVHLFCFFLVVNYIYTSNLNWETQKKDVICGPITPGITKICCTKVAEKWKSLYCSVWLN